LNDQDKKQGVMGWITQSNLPTFYPKVCSPFICFGRSSDLSLALHPSRDD